MGRGEARDDPRFNEERELQYTIAPASWSSGEVLDRVGTFDEAFNPVHRCEDLDLSTGRARPGIA